jgi:hypothetical protein
MVRDFLMCLRFEHDTSVYAGQYGLHWFAISTPLVTLTSSVYFLFRWHAPANSTDDNKPFRFVREHFC